MKRLLPVLVVATAASLGACAWVKPDRDGSKIRVAYDGNVHGCTKMGEIGVGVRDTLVFGVERNPIKVTDELESLARNEAATLNADTIVAINEPRNGEQRFGAYRCK